MSAALRADARDVDTTVARVERCGVEAAVVWDAYVARHPDASAYHDHSWGTLIHDVFGHDTHYLAVRRGERIAGVLPLVRLKSWLFGDFLVSVPYFNYGGVLADSADDRDALLAAASDLARELGVSHVELRHQANEPAAWPSRTDKVAMVLALPPGAEAFRKQLPTKLRSQTKRAVRENATTTFGGAELLDEFYAVFAENMRDLGTPVYPQRFFAAILDKFAARSTLAVVRHGGGPVACAFLIEHRGTMEIPWASSLRRVNHLSMNMFMYAQVLERAADRGVAHFDFGRSTMDSGTFRFKSQWGAVPRQLYWHYWLKSGGEPPRINPDNSKYRLAVSAWQRLPLAVATWLGPHLVKNLP
jgi:serine/alanine adding enzyme